MKIQKLLNITVLGVIMLSFLAGCTENDKLVDNVTTITGLMKGKIQK